MNNERERIREAVLADVPALVRHRTAMFTEMGLLRESLAPELARAAERFFISGMTSGDYIAWVATAHDRPDEIVAGAGMQLRSILPFPDRDYGVIAVGREGLVANVYVEPRARRRGLARRLMLRVLSWARDHGVHPIRLHASNDGRPLYAQLGFEQTNEMRLRRAFNEEEEREVLS